MNNVKAKQRLQKYNVDLERLNVHTHHGCNLRCHGCSHHSDVVSPSSFVEDEIQILKDLDYITDRLKIHQISVLGGEPLLNPKFTKQVCELLVSKNQFTKLITNGTLLMRNKDWIIDLLNRGMLLKISIHLMPTRDRNAVKILDEINNFIDEAQKHNITCDALSLYSQDNKIGGHIVMEDSWRIPWDTFFKHEGEHVYPYNDDAKEAIESCVSVCPKLFKGKLYKCPHSALLDDTLHIYGQTDDPEWQKYLSLKRGYNIYDDDELKSFLETVYEPEQICSSCPGLENKQQTWHHQNYNVDKKDFIHIKSV